MSQYPKEAVVFELVAQDPDGSGVDFVLPRGILIEGQGRCCNNCNLILGDVGHTGLDMMILFTPKELRPITASARSMLAIAKAGR